LLKLYSSIAKGNTFYFALCCLQLLSIRSSQEPHSQLQQHSPTSLAQQRACKTALNHGGGRKKKTLGNGKMQLISS